jgi:hypothetical protein
MAALLPAPPAGFIDSRHRPFAHRLRSPQKDPKLSTAKVAFYHFVGADIPNPIASADSSAFIEIRFSQMVFTEEGGSMKFSHWQARLDSPRPEDLISFQVNFERRKPASHDTKAAPASLPAATQPT